MDIENNLTLCAAHEAAHAVLGHYQCNPVGKDGIKVDGHGWGKVDFSPRFTIGIDAYVRGLGKKLTFRMLCAELTELMAGDVVESILYGVDPSTYRDAVDFYEEYEDNPEYYLEYEGVCDFTKIGQILHEWSDVFPEARVERIFDLCMARTFRLVDRLLAPIELLSNALLEQGTVSMETTHDLLGSAGVEMHVNCSKRQ
jgi:hypothetical protein